MIQISTVKLKAIFFFINYLHFNTWSYRVNIHFHKKEGSKKEFPKINNFSIPTVSNEAW